MPHGDGFADEADDYERLIAAERIHEWLEHARAVATCRAEEADGPPPQRWKALQRKAGRSLSAFAEHVATSAAYAEEAHLLGAPDALTKLLASEELSEELTDAVSAALAAISGPGAAPPRTRSVPVAGTSVVVEEGALADGLGARLWRAALLLCESREFAPLIAGREVLELGAGVGLSGIAAARLGASRVVLTDCEATVLEILDRNAAANREVCAPCPLEVAYLQWADDALDACAPERRSGWEAEPPSHASLERGRKFDAVIAADFVYDDAHADLIPAVLAARVRPGGGALLLAACGPAEEARPAAPQRAAQRCRPAAEGPGGCHRSGAGPVLLADAEGGVPQAPRQRGGAARLRGHARPDGVPLRSGPAHFSGA